MHAKIIVPIVTLTLFISAATKANESLELTSPAFSDGALLPVQFTCEGEGISPPLNWSGVPDETQSLVVIMDHMPDTRVDSKSKLDLEPELDLELESKPESQLSSKEENRPPPPPKSAKAEGLRWYWTMYNIPVDTSGVTTGNSVGTLGGNVVNSNNEYSPPCSKGPGKKNYSFHLYALSSLLDISEIEPVSESTLRKHMSGLILDSDSLTVSFTRSCQSPPKPRLKPNSEPSDHTEEKEPKEPPSGMPPCAPVIDSLVTSNIEKK
ncbi:YbhB/YbcL family Raf kinase inhibitor-like protein [Vibrio algarum]|uniref:YbhB/YbcL family Raf kinase inhibitor-like protein n=1 Tax=Vibrio algarum TaxID=3020714 RepID=A0ABT4YRP2_9VIBR|nr:YbhB/YbcL family Raf kinase inhibitor-like protein [Vibrio sp. KJ40-1]MDB1124224.1 YbhB/YbcL family Raf kinase inhibitor-like protein [Vibrio sp. KJ40-1]